MTIEKLPSGKYRISQMVDGKRYRVVIDHKPTKIEAQKLILEKIEVKYTDADMPFEVACKAYLEDKSNVVSVSTIKGYEAVIRAISGDFKALKLSEIDRPTFQREVNQYSLNHSPKSVRNLSGFISAVLNFNGITLPPIRLPQKEKKEVYIPSEDDVKRILEYFKGKEHEPAICLATMGLRRSEICALTLADLNGNVLTINKALVQNSNNEWIIKQTKTTDSTRTIVIPDYLADLIRKRGYVSARHPGNITEALFRAQEKLGIPKFPLHKLRHFYASYLHNLGYTDKQIQSMGGWKTDAVMKSVYTHAMEMEKAKESAASDIGNLFS